MTPNGRLIQAVLFGAPEPLGITQLAKATGLTAGEIETAVSELEAALEHSGLRLSRHDHKYRLVSAPEASQAIANLYADSRSTELSAAALETLAIIAYRGPITRLAIEEVRGVNCDAMVRNLISRGLIEEAGRSDEPGKAWRYRVSRLFLDTLGLTNLDQLPPLPEPQS